MNRKALFRISAILAAVLMILQYGVMPLLHVHAHKAEGPYHGKAPSEENCAFAKVAEAPVHTMGPPNVCLLLPVFEAVTANAPLPNLRSTSVGPASSRGPPVPA